MDIGLAEFDDLSVGWRSATGFRHPGLHEVNDEDGLSWLRSMSGLLVSAGFEPGFDPAAFLAFFEWLNLREGSYVVGLEPSTHHVTGDAAARADGSTIWFTHGAERRCGTVFRFLRPKPRRT